MRTHTLRSLLLLALLTSGLDLAAVELPLAGTTLAGDRLAIDPVQKKRPVVLVFWASWCAVCVREMPSLKRFQSLAAAKVDLVSFSIDTDPEAAKAMAARQQLNYPVILDGGMAIAERFAVEATPTMILLGADGRELARGRSLGQLERALTALGVVQP